ncbi:MAG: hypothetical protein V4510_06310 [bacterium]
MGINRQSRLSSPLAIPGYILAPNGGKVFYVCSLGIQDDTTADLAGSLSTTWNAALAQCRANRGDVVQILPGHVETVVGTDILSNQVAGVRTVGIGFGTERPTFTFTGATDQFLLNDANCSYENLIFKNGSSNTTLAWDVTAAGVRFHNCYVQASDASNKLTSVMRLSSGANDFVMEDTDIIGGSTALTDTFLTNAAVARVRLERCYMAAALGVAEGLVTMATAAPTRMRIYDCTFENTVASSTVALKGIAAATGTIRDVRLGITVADGAGVGVAGFNTKGNFNIYNVTTSSIGLGQVASVAATTA